MFSNLPTMLSQQDFQARHADMLASARDGRTIDPCSIRQTSIPWHVLDEDETIAEACRRYLAIFELGVNIDYTSEADNSNPVIEVRRAVAFVPRTRVDTEVARTVDPDAQKVVVNVQQHSPENAQYIPQSRTGGSTISIGFLQSGLRILEGEEKSCASKIIEDAQRRYRECQFARENAKIGAQLRIRLPADYVVTDGPGISICDRIASTPAADI